MATNDATPARASRRAFIRTAGAVLPTIAIAGSATAADLTTAEPDPIFAAIEAHKAAVARSNETYGSQTESAPSEASLACFEADEAALADLIETAPTTRAGAQAKLDYLSDTCSCSDQCLAMAYLKTLERSPLLGRRA